MAAKYECLREPVAGRDGYALVSLRKSDLFRIMRWRNEQIDVLRQSAPLTRQDQERYFREVILPSQSVPRPRLILVSFLAAGVCIGYGGLTHIDWESERAEVSFLVDTARARDVSQYQRDFAAFLELLEVLAFDRLRLRRLFTETYDIRPQHVATLEAAGFRREGRLRAHYSIRGALVDALFHGLLREDRHAQG